MATPSQILVEDICTRFILTAPAEEHQSFEHLMFLVEEAHWYYEDTVRDKDRHLKSYNLNSFTRMIFEVCPELCAYVGDLEDILGRFREYKKNVPSMGAIILDKDMDRVLLVKGYQSAACWGFPKGKISSMDGSHAECAIREVLEETAFDIEPYLQEEDCISKEVMGKRMKLYIIPGVDHLTTQFFPKCKGEIGAYAWHLVSDLPATYDEDKQTFISMDGTRHKFFTVWPFVKALKEWIARKKARNAKHASAAAKAAPGKQRSGTANGALFKQAVAAATAPVKLERHASDPTQAQNPEAASDTATSPYLSFQGQLPSLPSQGRDLLDLLNSSSRSSSMSPTSSVSSSPPSRRPVQHPTASVSMPASAGRRPKGAPANVHTRRTAALGGDAPLGHSDSTKAMSVNAGAVDSSKHTRAETSPTAPSTPPPTTSLPKVYTAADLEGRIMTSSLPDNTSGTLLLSMLRQDAPAAGSDGPTSPFQGTALPRTLPAPCSATPAGKGAQASATAAPGYMQPAAAASVHASAPRGVDLLAILNGATAQPKGGASTTARWADFRFDVASIMQAFE